MSCLAERRAGEQLRRLLRITPLTLAAVETTPSPTVEAVAGDLSEHGADGMNVAPAFTKWPARLAAPVDAQETQIRMRAQSILSGPELGQCPPLTLAQAQDVIAWHSNVHTLNTRAAPPGRAPAEVDPPTPTD